MKKNSIIYLASLAVVCVLILILLYPYETSAETDVFTHSEYETSTETDVFTHSDIGRSDFIELSYSTYEFKDEIISRNELDDIIVEKHELRIVGVNGYSLYWVVIPKDSKGTLFLIHGSDTNYNIQDSSNASVARNTGYTTYILIWRSLEVENSSFSIYNPMLEFDTVLNGMIHAYYIYENCILPGIDNEQVVIWGSSRGGEIANYIAANFSNVKSLILTGNSPDIEDLYGRSRLIDANTIDQNTPSMIDGKSFFRTISDRNIPVYVFLTTADEWYPVADAFSFFDDYKNVRIVLIPNSNHQISRFYDSAYVGRVMDAVVSSPLYEKPTLVFDSNAQATLNTYQNFPISVQWDGVRIDMLYYSNGDNIMFLFWNIASMRGSQYYVMSYNDVQLNIIIEGTELLTELKVSYLFENVSAWSVAQTE